jgi:hypothetical protein
MNDPLSPESTINSAFRKNPVESQSGKKLACESAIASANSRRNFIKRAALATTAVGIGSTFFSRSIIPGSFADSNSSKKSSRQKTNSSDGPGYFCTSACGGIALEGYAPKGIGVYGEGEFDGVYGYSSYGIGVHGYGEEYGVTAYSPYGIGVWGEGRYGLYGIGDLGVVGASSCQYGIGVEGFSDCGLGVYGSSLGAAGVVGESHLAAGVYGGSEGAPGVAGVYYYYCNCCVCCCAALSSHEKVKSDIPRKRRIRNLPNQASSAKAGVLGTTCNVSGIGVLGLAGTVCSVPLAARAYSGKQTANLQEWQKACGSELSVVTRNGWLGIGTGTPNTTLQVNGGFSVGTKMVTKNFSMTSSDFAVLVNAGVEALKVTLPTADNTGQVVLVKKVDASANDVTVNALIGNTIEGKSSMTLSAQYDSVTLIAGGNGVWYIQSSAT